MYSFWWAITIGWMIASHADSVQIDVPKVAESVSTTNQPSTITIPTITKTDTNPLAKNTPTVITAVISQNGTEIPTTTTAMTNSLNSTVKIDEATTAIPIGNTSVIEQPKSTWWNKARREVTNRLNLPSDYFCSCDLTINICDLNCCCDIDCTKAMQSSLSCDEHDQTIFDYTWQPSMVPCSLQNGLFCVIRQNELNEEFYDSSKRNHQTHKWPSNTLSIVESENEDRESYQQNDPILVYREISETVELLTLPAALTGIHCHIKLPVRFLSTSQKSICIRSATEHNTFIRKLQHELLNTKMLSSRRGIKKHAMMSELCVDESTLDMNCHSIDIFQCVGSISLANCSRLNETEYEIDPSFNNQLIVLEFVHNFTNILNGSAFFVYSMDTGRPERTMEIRFRQLEELRKPHHTVSGNLGYQTGRPIIISHWTPANASDEHSPMIANYFHPNNSKRHDDSHELLRIPIFLQNECRLDNDTFETIAFGQDVCVKCDVRFERNHTESTATNLTLLCQQFQTTIFRFILNEVRQKEQQIDTIVSSLGNPRNVSTQWTQLAIDSTTIGLAEFKGEPEDGGFRCRNIVLGVGYEFETARLRIKGQPHQNRIMGVKIRLIDRVDLKFGWDEDVWSVPVFVDAIFFDMTGKSRRLNGSTWMIAMLVGVYILLCITE